MTNPGENITEKDTSVPSVEVEPGVDFLDMMATLQYTASVERLVATRNLCQVLFDLVTTILAVVILLAHHSFDRAFALLVAVNLYLYAVDFSNFSSSIDTLRDPGTPDPDNVARVMVTFTLLARSMAVFLLVWTAYN